MYRRPALALVLVLLASTLDAATWTSHGPAGGNVVSLVAAPSNPKVFYLSSSGGAFKSIDGGATWARLEGVTQGSFAVDPHDENTVYFAGVALGGPLRKSTDGGATWTKVGDGLPPVLRTTALLIDPRDSNVIYVGSACGPIWKGPPSSAWHEGSGVFKSTDGGATFTAAMMGMRGFQICVNQLSLDPVNPDTLYATPPFTDSGYARSDDGARTWTKAATIVPGGGSVADPRDPLRRYGAGMGFFLTSDDGGKTWTIRTSHVLDTGQALSYNGAFMVVVDPSAPRLFIGGFGGVFRSGDGGQSLLAIPGPGRESVHGMVFDQTSGALTLGTASGVYQSLGYPWTDWKVLPTGDASRAVQRVAPSLRDPSVAYAASLGHLFISRDAGLSWSLFGDTLPLVNLVVGHIGSPAVDAAETVYVTVTTFTVTRIFKLPAGAPRWIDVTPPGAPFGRLFPDPKTPGVLYLAGSDGFYATRDGGSSWEFLVTPAGSHAFSVAIDHDDPRVLYASTFRGILKSTDGGQNWTVSLEPSDSLAMVAVSPADSSVVYADGKDANFKRFFFRSTDRGLTWTAMSEVPGGGVLLSLVPDVRDPDTVYIAAGPHRVYRSRDGGAHWEPLAAGLRPDLSPQLAINADGTVLHAATERGMWRLPLRGRRRAVR